MSYSSLNTIKTVAGREIIVATRSKGIILSLVITLVVIIAGIGVITWLSNRESSDPEVVLYGIEESYFEVPEATGAADSPVFPGAGLSSLDLSTAASPEDARERVAEGADAALVLNNGRFDLISDGDPNAGILATLNIGLSSYSQTEALGAVNIAPDDYYAALPDVSLNLVNIGEESDFAAIITVLAGVSVLIFFIMLFAGNIGGRVTEEKSSRVVEIILSSVRPLDFLAGKLLGNMLVGLIGTVVILGIAMIALSFSGLLDDFDLDLTVLPILALAYILGLLFFGSLWAAAGAMVSRSEDLASTQTPIMIFVFGVIYAPAFGWSALDSTIMQVLSWLPPFSLSVAPLQGAAGNMSWALVLASYAVMALVTFLVLLLVARIYRNAILHNGRKMKWTQALKSAK
ncbi:ABC transporter permease [Corynebacterium sp. A21]|uniref:ABC transporter permease n=1 Tax=Corynebacterium sp. A21 TaxID=3457318 RepID=UPI003FD0C13F